MNQLDVVRLHLAGCYEGKDRTGETFQFGVQYLSKQQGDLLNFKVKGEFRDSLLLSFHQNNSALVTQLFEEGSFVDSRVLNDTISYSFTGEIERDFPNAKINNETLITFKQKGNLLMVDILQNSIRDILDEFYEGKAALAWGHYELKKVSCTK